MADKNALAIIDSNVFLALSEGSEVREALEYNLTSGERISIRDLTRVKTTGGGTKWLWEERGQERMESEIVGLLVGCFRVGTLWPSETSAVGVPPVLVTNDLITARRVSDDIGDLDPEILESCKIGDREYDWRRLPYTKIGTSKDGHSARAKEGRVLCILTKEDPFPLRINVGIGSLKTITPFIKTLPVPSFRCVVSLHKEKAVSKGGQEYALVVPKLEGVISKEAGAMVRKLYTDPLQADMENDIASAVSED